MAEVYLHERTLEEKIAYMQGYIAAMKEVKEELDKLAKRIHGINKTLEHEKEKQ